MSGKRCSIVFEEVIAPTEGVGGRFNVFLDGVDLMECQAMSDQERREKLTAAAFWCYETFARGVLPLMAASGVIDGTKLRKK